MRKERMVVTLPKFKMESKFNANTVLHNLGMVDAFQESIANFSGMTTIEKLFIDKVVHKAFVNVDEKGTEAAALKYIQRSVVECI
ncbi:serpin family protein [Candidatus Uabimicrobium sp. HlEnr_7]|uniref:serpin family protein n=1 Tax=Candidatus Uabimicrobium helgolandensis TaxID=3095367 RepID=UPI0035561D72